MKTRRKYKPGKCSDCGRSESVTRIVFWVNGYIMHVCKNCIKPYRKVILKPCSPECSCPR